MKFSNQDIQRLRRLAGEQAEIAASDKMRALYKEWMRHGSFQPDARPMLTIEMWTFADDVIPQLLQCTDPKARAIEKQLLMNVIPYRDFGDDTPVRNHFPVTLHSRKKFIPFNLPTRMSTADNSDYVGAGQHFETYMHDVEEDFHLLQPSTFSFDVEGVERQIETLNEIFGDILPARKAGESLCATVAEDIIHIVDMETLYLALYETPELVHEMFDRLVNDYMKWLDAWEENGYLCPTAGDEPLPEGSFCFTDRLPASGENLKLNQVWGYMDAEEFNDVSPQMYKEFILEHYKPILKRFGAVSFGCCEALHNVWEDGLDQFENLRKVSVSAWCDVRRMGNYLRGRDVVYLRKPTANLLGVGKELDEDAVRAYFKETAEAASGCRLEITQRDVYYLHNTPDKVTRYMQLMRETVDKYWKP